MTTRRAAFSLAGTALLATRLLMPGLAYAQPANTAAKAAAQALFDEARQLTVENNFEAACPKLAESHRLDPTVGTKFYLAECLERIGKLASAWTYYIEAADGAGATGQKQRADFARERAAAVKGRLSTITITVPESVRGLSGLELQRNGVPLGEAQWGTAVPVDPGEHTISAVAEGYTRCETRVEIKAEQQAITVQVPSLQAQKSEKSSITKPELPPPPPPEAPDTGRGKAQRIAGIVVGSAGIAGIGAGAAFGGIAMSKQKASNADGHCDASNFCDNTGLSLRREAITFAIISTVGLIAGGALVAGGVIILLTAPSAQAQTRAVNQSGSAAIAAGPGSLWITGQW